MHSVTKNLSEALKQSQQIVELSKEQQWEQVQQALDQRDQLIRAALEEPATADIAEEVRGLIHKIKTIDQEISKLAKTHQVEIYSELKQQQKGKKMKAAYAQAKRPF